MKVCIVGASGKLGQYMIRHALDAGYQVICVCRPESVHKLATIGDHLTIFPARTDDRNIISRAVAECDAVLTVLVPWGVNHYSTGTAQAVLDFAPPDARLIFSCGWHISRDGLDRYSLALKLFVVVFGGCCQSNGVEPNQDALLRRLCIQFLQQTTGSREHPRPSASQQPLSMIAHPFALTTPSR